MQIYAAAGVTIEPGQAWVYTGVLGAGALAGGYEVNKPSVTGAPVHGFAGPSAVTDVALVDDAIVLAEFGTLQITGSCAAGDVLNARTDGTVEKRTALAASIGQALTASSGGSVLAALFLGPPRQSVIAVGSTSAPTESGGTFVVIPEMQGTLTLRNGTGITAVGNVNLELQVGDEVEVSMFLVDASSAATEITGMRSTLTGDGKVRVPVTTQIAPSEITGPTPHTVQIRWRAITGTARAISTNRRLFAAEF